MSRKRLQAVLERRRRARQVVDAEFAAREIKNDPQAGPVHYTPHVTRNLDRVRRGAGRRARYRLPALRSSITTLHPLLPDLDPTDIMVSVVFGTYNRLPLLQDCVASIRKAARGVKYEIVVCDGGSTDGSVDWLKAQRDVVYIPGALSGAVPAFNAAAQRARGEFILALNDDAQLHVTAIRNGLRHFIDRRVGQVALGFHEHGHWKIEFIHGLPYANFALTRTNIVRAVERITGGMWAPCYQTYGGDTELSCWVHRLGYKVAPAQDAQVEHLEYVDALRQRNVRDQKRQQFHHRWKDSAALTFRGPYPKVSLSEVQRLAETEKGETVRQRWSRIETADPTPGHIPERAVLRPERVLHWQLWTDDDPQTSMVSALKKLGSVGHLCVPWTQVGVAERGPTFVEAARALRPSIMFVQCQDPNAVPVAAIKAVRDDPSRDPSLVICVWSGDIGPGKGPWAGSGDEWQYGLASVVDLMLFTGTGQVEHHRRRGMSNAAYLQIGYDTDRYYAGPPDQYGTQHQLVFMGQDYGPHFDTVPGSEAALRRQAVAVLRDVPGFIAYGGGFGPGIAQVESGDVYRRSAMALSISLTSNLGRYTSDRLLRAMACGCPTLVKRFDDMKGMGLVDGTNCIGWDTPSELASNARAWLAPERRQQLQSIGAAGGTLMRTNHTWDVRMQELTAIVNAVRKQQ